MELAEQMIKMGLRETNLSSKISGNRNKSTVSSQMEDEERARIQANQNVTRLWKNKPEKKSKKEKKNKNELEIEVDEKERFERKPKKFTEKEDKRLALLAQAESTDLDSIRERRMKMMDEEMNENRRKKAESSEEEEEGFGNQEEESNLETIRQNRELRALYQKRDDDEEEEAGFENMEDEEEEEEYEEYDTEEEYEEEEDNYFRPMFIKKSDRTSIKTKEQIEEEEKQKEEEEKQKEQARLEEAQKILANHAQLEENQKQEEQQKQEEAVLYEDQEENMEEEYEKWRQREFERCKRELKIRQEQKMNEEEKERRAKMTDEELIRENREKDLYQKKPKGHMKYMQKYYHKGAFFQDGEQLNDEKHLLDRDYTAPTGRDKFNLSMLPEIYQVRDFGKKSRSKWTTIAKEDTTLKNDWLSKKKQKYIRCSIESKK